jgi:hypothetical protein
MGSFLLMLGFFSILRPGLPTRNPEFGRECPLVSASQTRLNGFRESPTSLEGPVIAEKCAYLSWRSSFSRRAWLLASSVFIADI